MTNKSTISELIIDYARRPRILYAIVFSWMAWTGGRFTAPFLKQEIGFDDGQIGFLLACQKGLATVIGPICGIIADNRQKKHKNGRVEILCAGLCLGSLTTLFHGIAYVFPVFSYTADAPKMMKQITFLWHLSLRLLYSISNVLVLPVLDGLTLAYLEADKHADRADYGKERLHGAIWWAIANIILGPILDLMGFQAIYFTSILVLFGCFAAIFLYTSSLDSKIVDNSSATNQSISISSPKLNSLGHTDRSVFFFLKIICGTIYGASFLFCFFTLNTGTSVVENLIFLFFSDLGGSNTICGFTVIITVLFEFPIFHYAPLILRKVGSGSIQTIACLAFVTRVLGYSVIPNNHMSYVLLLEPLHGVTYAFAQTSAVEFFAKFMPPGYEARGQGIMNIFSGAGSFVGLSLGGWAEENFGPRIMYRGFAVAIFLAMVQFYASEKWECLRKNSQAGTKEENRGLLTGTMESKDKTKEPIRVV